MADLSDLGEVRIADSLDGDGQVLSPLRKLFDSEVVRRKESLWATLLEQRLRDRHDDRDLYFDRLSADEVSRSGRTAAGEAQDT